MAVAVALAGQNRLDLTPVFCRNFLPKKLQNKCLEMSAMGYNPDAQTIVQAL
jgi:hypothetical protein